MYEIKLKPCPFCGGTAGAIGDGAFDEDLGQMLGMRRRNFPL